MKVLKSNRKDVKGKTDGGNFRSSAALVGGLVSAAAGKQTYGRHEFEETGL